MSYDIISILQMRDGVTKEEARKMIDDCREMCFDAFASGDIDEVENIIMEELGLEMDYADEILGCV